MKVKELRDLGIGELKAKEAELRQSHFNLRFQHATKQLENTAGLKKVRSDIAKVLTVITEKQRSGGR